MILFMVFPALFRTEKHWLLISETGVDGNYVASHLADSLVLLSMQNRKYAMFIYGENGRQFFRISSAILLFR